MKNFFILDKERTFRTQLDFKTIRGDIVGGFMASVVMLPIGMAIGIAGARQFEVSSTIGLEVSSQTQSG